MTAGGTFDPHAYGARVEEILAQAGWGRRLMPLVAVKGGVQAPAALLHGKSEILFPSSYAPQAALAGLMLYFDLSDEAHALAQDLETPEGNFWHAILHRREPDAGNATYWFQRVDRHPVYPAIAKQAREILSAFPEAGFVCCERWDPLAFLGFCESIREGRQSSGRQAALEIQRAEWQTLFHFCARAVR